MQYAGPPHLEPVVNILFRRFCVLLPLDDPGPDINAGAVTVDYSVEPPRITIHHHANSAIAAALHAKFDEGSSSSFTPAAIAQTLAAAPRRPETHPFFYHLAQGIIIADPQKIHAVAKGREDDKHPYFDHSFAYALARWDIGRSAYAVESARLHRVLLQSVQRDDQSSLVAKHARALQQHNGFVHDHGLEALSHVTSCVVADYLCEGYSTLKERRSPPGLYEELQRNLMGRTPRELIALVKDYQDDIYLGRDRQSNVA